MLRHKVGGSTRIMLYMAFRQRGGSGAVNRIIIHAYGRPPATHLAIEDKNCGFLLCMAGMIHHDRMSVSPSCRAVAESRVAPRAVHWGIDWIFSCASVRWPLLQSNRVDVDVYVFTNGRNGAVWGLGVGGSGRWIQVWW